jgi:hypothetical protein
VQDGDEERVIVNGLGVGLLGSPTGDAALFGLDDVRTPEPLQLMGLGANQASSIVVVAGDVVYVGRFDLETFTNQIFALSIADVLLAFDGVSPPLPTTPFLTVPVLLGASSLGDALVFVEGDASFAPDRVLAVSPVRQEGAIVAGEPRTVLDVNACTRSTFVVPLGEGLLVGLSDVVGGDRIIHIEAEAPAP